MSDWFRSFGFADVLEGLLVGAYPLDQDDVAMLARLGVRRILNLTEDVEYRPGDREAVQGALTAAGIDERRLSLIDYGRLPPTTLESAIRQVNAWLDEGDRVYIHCRAGRQRSSAVAAGVVALREGRDIADALAYVQARKPSAVPLPHQLEDLDRWWSSRSGAPGGSQRGERRERS